MVYNTYHRIDTSAFQLAVRTITGNSNQPDLEQDLLIAKWIIDGFRENNYMAGFLESVRHEPDAAFADSLLQPVEHSYTIDSLNKMASSCDLELLEFCLDQFSRAHKNYDWNMRFSNEKLQVHYDALPDIERWQVTNLLKAENSPMLWFYLQKKESLRKRKSQKTICKEFLNQQFKKTDLTKEIFVQNESGYESEPVAVDFPSKVRFPCLEAKIIYDQLDENACLRETFEQCGITLSFSTVNYLRSCLATSSYPYLVASSSIKS